MSFFAKCDYLVKMKARLSGDNFLGTVTVKMKLK